MLLNEHEVLEVLYQFHLLQKVLLSGVLVDEMLVELGGDELATGVFAIVTLPGLPRITLVGLFQEFLV
jgi:hypothetical protein